MALQFIAINGLWLRGDRRWMARAISSLPVPLSPLISTALSLRDIFATVWSTRLIASLRPTISGNA